MKKTKILRLKVFKENELVFSTPCTPDLVVGLLSAFNAPENESMIIEVSIDELEVPDEKENH